MRMLILPAALLLGAALYISLPQARIWRDDALRALLARIRRLFADKQGTTDERSALAVYLLAAAAAATLLCAVHPLAAALLCAPLFAGFAPLPACAAAKRELDSGKFVKDVPAYERRVLSACAPLGETFALDVAAPMLLCALSMLLHLGCSLGWIYAALRAAQPDALAAKKFISFVNRAAEKTTVFFLLLCAGLFGRNPLRIGGNGANEKLMRILSLEGDIDHAPISGDITQAIFLCCLSTGLLCALLTLTGVLLA